MAAVAMSVDSIAPEVEEPPGSKMPDFVPKFLALLEEHKGKKWVFVNHDNPDPDSISCAFVLMKVVEAFGIEHTEIVYCGDISHPQNRAMINVLNITATKLEIDDVPMLDKERTVYVYVDCVPGNKNVSICMRPVLCFDHHKISKKPDCLLLHREVGACATVICQFGAAIKDELGKRYPLSPDNENVQSMATALALGIKTDTSDFRSEGTTEDDFRAFKGLSRVLNDTKFQKIVNYELPPHVLDYETMAWQNKREPCVPNLITGLGYIPESHSDAIPHIADKFMRLQGVQTVVVYAIVGNNSIRASVRTSSASVDTKGLCDEVFGRGNGGAKQGVGGARVQLSLFNATDWDNERRENFWEMTKFQVEENFVKAVSK